MMESINFRAGMSALLLRTTQATLAEVPPKARAIDRLGRLRSIPAKVSRHRDRWLVGANLIQIQPPVQTENPAFSSHQWLLSGNPRLAQIVTAAIGDLWMTYIEDLEQLIPLADDLQFQSRWQAVKRVNKHVLAETLYRMEGIEIDVDSLFDLQLQPIGGQHRQLLNILHIINLFDRLKQSPDTEIVARTFIFGELDEVSTATEADASESTDIDFSRSIVALIKSVAAVIAADPDVSKKLQVVYVPASAGLTSQMYAAADVTQQISTAAIEDVNLKQLEATVNGAISIGSLGKTNYWLQQIVGEENCFRFGLAIPEIALFKEYGYDPYNYYKYYPQIRKAIDYLSSGYFTPEEPNIGRSIVATLLGADEHMVMADYIFYAACQAHVNDTYAQASTWTRMSILNVAGVR
ncbi:glycogen/starch/alpha-glucan phosphorylase [Chamaesiphon sp. VAR_48_metabat_403]|uniref:glycogen/starch/alpha-glucan phosphorylase n=1 Tax=Chamaesiphon sp. VAR_48_metabat_403 TaxID=2964700 RepID=UPI00286DE238|nr:glycogen/starch/alpha-glucan phosphorylase [Chamaesiphon sp. VAR_48_metabat_403]